MIRAPWWALSLVAFAWFGLFSVLNYRFLQGAGWGEAVVAGLLSGLVFGLITGPVFARINRRYRESVGEENVDRLVRLGWRGWRAKVGDDAELRAAARRATLLQREQLLRQRRWGIPFLVLMIGLDIWLALTASLWWLLAGALFAGMLVLHLVMPARLERRAEELRDPASETP
jgi:hypothetical protein